MVTWHALLAPLPADAIVRRRPVTPPEMANDPAVAAIAGWEQLTVELSAGPAGLRHVMVVLDAAGQPISAGDHVLTCRELTDAATTGDGVCCEYVHESLGGRLEPDGSFNGTRWRMVRVAAPDEAGGAEDDSDATPFDAQPSTPTADDVAGIKALVADIFRRASERRD